MNITTKKKENKHVRWLERRFRMDKKTTIKEFLEFRSKFTKREWHELNQAIDERLKQKADQLKLDDSDLVVISDKLKRFI